MYSAIFHVEWYVASTVVAAPGGEPDQWVQRTNQPLPEKVGVVSY